MVWWFASIRELLLPVCMPVHLHCVYATMMETNSSILSKWNENCWHLSNLKKWSTLEILKHWIAPSPQKNNLTDLFVYCTVQLNTYTANWKSFPSWYNPEWKDCDVLIAALLWVTWHISGIARIFLKLRNGVEVCIIWCKTAGC